MGHPMIPQPGLKITMGILLYSFYKCITIQVFRPNALYLMSLLAHTLGIA